MTFGIISESDREGRAVCQSWLPGGKHNVTPTDKNSVRRESPQGPPDPPFFLGKGLTNTMLFSDYHLAKLNPKCHMNYLDYL